MDARLNEGSVDEGSRLTTIFLLCFRYDRSLAEDGSQDPQPQPLSHTIIPLPFLACPVMTPTTDSLVASLAITPSPSSAGVQVLDPFTVTLTVHNLSPSDLAASLQLQVESSDTFAWAGPRQMRLPLLLAGQSRVVTMQLVALKVGWARLPRIRLWELIAPEEGGMSGEVVTREVPVAQESAGRGEVEEDAGGAGMRVFVLPR